MCPFLRFKYRFSKGTSFTDKFIMMQKIWSRQKIMKYIYNEILILSSSKLCPSWASLNPSSSSIQYYWEPNFDMIWHYDLPNKELEYVLKIINETSGQKEKEEFNLLAIVHSFMQMRYGIGILIDKYRDSIIFTSIPLSYYKSKRVQ